METLYSGPNITVARYRMRSSQGLDKIDTKGNEHLFIPLTGEVELSGPAFHDPMKLMTKDVCYVPRDEQVQVKRLTETSELIIASAPARNKIAPYVKRFADVKPSDSGSDQAHRRIVLMLGEGDRAERFLCGYTESQKGNWTGFPPHRHDDKVEVYVFYGMNGKFGFQMVASEDSEEAYVVRDGDCVGIEKGYHPNVPDLTTSINFLWIMSARPESRNLSVNIHPAYKDVPTGSSPLTTK